MHRRDFLSAAAQSVVFGAAAIHLRRGDSIAAAEETAGHVVTNERHQRRKAPLYLNQRSFGDAPLFEFVNHARIWGFDGVELIVSRIVAEASRSKQSVADLMQTVVKSPVTENGRNFQLCLCFDSGAGPTLIGQDAEKQVVDILDHAHFVQCSIAPPNPLSADPSEYVTSVSREVEMLRKAKEHPSSILIENPRIASAVDIDRFLDSFKQLPAGVGILLRTSEIKIRLDLALQEIRFKLAELDNAGAKSAVNAIRLEVETSVASIRNLNYQMELYRRALTEQAIASGDDDHGVLFQSETAFISLESSTQLRWTSSKDGSKPEMGSTAFRQVKDGLDADVLAVKQ